MSDPTNTEIMALLVALREEVREIKHGMGTFRTAFIRNDLSEPDYEGHRQDHLLRKKSADNFEGMKMALAMKVVLAVGGFLALVFWSGLGTQLQKLTGN